MKIVDVKTYVVGNPPPHRGGLNWIFLKLVTDEGIEGWGECNSPRYRERTIVQLIHELSSRFVFGEDPFDIEKIWERLYKSTQTNTSHFFQHPGTLTGQVIGAYEMACWDIVGKKLNQPVYRLLGGVKNEKIRAYTYLYTWSFGMPPEQAGAEALKLVEQGFTLFKLDPVRPYSPQPREISLKELRYAEDVFKNIRDTVGDDCDIGCGTHGQFNTHSAIRLAKILEKYDVLWFEEPVPLENIDEMARLAQHTSVPIATGERLSTKWDYRLLLEKQAAQIIQVNVGLSGILEAKKIAGMAEAHYAQIAPWMHCGPVAAAANIQLDVTCPNVLAQEGIEMMGNSPADTNTLERDIIEIPIIVEDGYIIPSKAPGLGIGRVKEEILDQYPYQPEHLTSSYKIGDRYRKYP
jgi:2-dehydro-3-deoxyphosphogalactonate aldolase